MMMQTMMMHGQAGRTTRRAFLGGCAGFGGLAALGGCAGLRADRCAPSAPPNYWCTWATQARLVDANVKSGVLAVPGDQGLPGVRDNLTEAVLFGKDGWAHTQYPSVRGNLYLVLDDGWDVPFGCAPGKDIGAFASCVLDARRFPSFTGTPAARLRALDARIRACGWRGTGLWIACQAFGENGRNKFPEERLREELKRKLAASAEAGVAYWKVDWGVRGGEIAYRRMMSELRAAYAPGLQIEHCCPPDVPLNGVSFGKGTSVSGTGRLLGDPAFETRLRARTEDVLAFSDVFRIYDTITPINNATDLERAAVYGQMAERVGSRAFINVEDNVYIAACLGHTAGVMRSPSWPKPDVEDPVYRRDRAAEVTRAVAWQRTAPAFTAQSGLRTLTSEAVLTDRWLFAPGCTWWTPVFGRTIEQRAPAVVARGLPLPAVAPQGGDVPFVLASRNPNGALTVGALPRLSVEKGFHTPLASVALDADLAPDVPLAVFGTFASVSVRIPPSCPRRVYACDLADGGTGREITHACRFDGGRLVIDGEALRLPPRAAGDRSLPGVRLRLG